MGRQALDAEALTRATFKVPLLWTLLLAFSLACVLASVVAWGILLTTLCSNPRTPTTQQVVSYNCHGMTVFISPLQDALLQWLTPVGMLFMLLALVAGAMVVRTAVSTWKGAASGRIRILAVPPGEAPAWVREKWVGLELPVTGLDAPASGKTSGVLSGSRTQASRSGFKVNVLEAIAVLERASPEAADWWRVNTPHLMKPSRFFLFPEACCAAVFREGD